MAVSDSVDRTGFGFYAARNSHEQPVEVVHAALARGRVAPAACRGASARRAPPPRRSPRPRPRRDRARRRRPCSSFDASHTNERKSTRVRSIACGCDEVQRQAPRIEVEHQVREDPPVARGDSRPCLVVRELQVRVAVQLARVGCRSRRPRSAPRARTGCGSPRGSSRRRAPSARSRRSRGRARDRGACARAGSFARLAVRVAEEGVERRGGIERGECLARPLARTRPAAGRRRAREILRLVELGHEGHAAGEVEAARVVAAADLLRAGTASPRGCCRDGCRRSTGSAASPAASRASSSGSSRKPGRRSRGASDPGLRRRRRAVPAIARCARRRARAAREDAARPNRTTLAALRATVMSGSIAYVIRSRRARAKARASRGSWCGRAGRRARSTGCTRA